MLAGEGNGRQRGHRRSLAPAFLLASAAHCSLRCEAAARRSTRGTQSQARRRCPAAPPAGRRTQRRERSRRAGAGSAGRNGAQSGPCSASAERAGEKGGANAGEATQREPAPACRWRCRLERRASRTKRFRQPPCASCERMRWGQAREHQSQKGQHSSLRAPNAGARRSASLLTARGARNALAHVLRARRQAGGRGRAGKAQREHSAPGRQRDGRRGALGRRQCQCGVHGGRAGGRRRVLAASSVPLCRAKESLPTLLEQSCCLRSCCKHAVEPASREREGAGRVAVSKQEKAGNENGRCPQCSSGHGQPARGGPAARSLTFRSVIGAGTQRVLRHASQPLVAPEQPVP